MSRITWGAKALALAAAAALTLSACGGGNAKSEDTSKDAASSGEVVKGGDITAAVAYKTNNYDPSSTSSALGLGANSQVMEGLYELNLATFESYKALAAEDEPTKVTDTQYEITLRKDAKFSDGTPVTIDDVVESFNRSTAEGNLYVSMLSFIKDVQKKDDTTLTINLNYPFTLLKQRLSLVKIIPASKTKEELTAFPVGTGPWMYDSITESEIKFKPNPNYNGDHPAAADTMTWQILPDDTARTTAMQQGTVAVMESVPADAASLLEGAGAKVEAVQGFNLPFLMFNTKKAPFDNAKVRQAFFYAIDTDKLIENAMSGKAEAATSFLPKEHPNYHKAKNVFTHDTDKAKNLLKEAGVDGLNITLLTTDHPWITALAPQIKNDLAAIGVNAEIKSLQSSSLYADNTDVDNPQFDVVLAPGDPSVFGNDPALLMSWWYGDNSWTKKRTQWGGSEGYTKLQEIINQAVQKEGDEQQKLWNEAFDLISDEVPLYPLFHRQIVTGYYPDKVSNFTPIATTGLSFIDAGAGASK